MNSHLFFSKLYIGLREVAVTTFSLIEEWFTNIEKVILKQIETKSTDYRIKRISEVLKRHFRYLNTHVQFDCEICYFHKQYFTKKMTLYRHFKSVGHINQECYLYDRYVAFAKNSKIYALSKDDELYLSGLEGVDSTVLPYKVTDLNLLRNKLPLLGLLNFDMSDASKKGGLVNILNVLGHSAGLTIDDQNSVLSTFHDCKVFIKLSNSTYKLNLYVELICWSISI